MASITTDLSVEVNDDNQLHVSGCFVVCARWPSLVRRRRLAVSSITLLPVCKYSWRKPGTSQQCWGSGRQKVDATGHLQSLDWTSTVDWTSGLDWSTETRNY